MRKLNYIIMCTALTLINQSIIYAHPCDNVPTEHWAYQAINELSEKGVFESIDKDYFIGNKPIDRYTFASILAKGLAEIEVKNAKAPFTFNKNIINTLEKLLSEFSDELSLLAIKYNGIEGKVLFLGLRTTKIQDLATSNILSIANRNIEQIEVVSNFIYVRIPMPYELPVEKAEKIIDSIVEHIKKNDNVNNCVYVSVNELAESFINYYLKIECNQLYKLQVRRDALRTILVTMGENNVSVPYTQFDIHEK